VKATMGRTGVIALFLAALVAAYGVYLVALGPILTVVTPGGPATTFHEPNAGGLIFIAGAAFVWYGVRRGKDRWAWTGAVVVLAFSVLALFGVGGILIPLALALVTVLTARRVLGQGPTLGTSKT
jgi:hypothetical protein